MPFERKCMPFGPESACRLNRKSYAVQPEFAQAVLIGIQWILEVPNIRLLRFNKSEQF